MLIACIRRPWCQIHIGRAREVFHDEVVLFTWAAPYLIR